MATTENSVGFLSSGMSIEPKTTSEFAPMIHKSLGGWNVMFHANAFLVDAQQTGPRGADNLFSTNWFMPMAARDFGRQTLTLRGMVSLEPATIARRRYPELFQTGETAYGLPIVDEDSTHVCNSVLTLGFVRGPMQLEASAFHGREPGENRWNLDGGSPDSFSSRITVGFGNDASGQFSIGRINNREALEPDVDTLRMTASIHHTLRFGSGHIVSSLIWGSNKDMHGGDVRVFNAYTAESTVNFLARNWAWTRIENVDRDRTILAGETPLALQVEETPVGRVQGYTFGYERDLPVGLSSLRVGIGMQATAYGLTREMKSVYGDHPAALMMFLHLRPAGNFGAHMQMMHQH